jgi:mRNA-degrading endonuclease RelE of RelBE toxin-antitoxin system
MDKLHKALQKLTRKERKAFLLIMQQLRNDYTKVPHCIQLQGKRGWFRVRIGQYRIISRVKRGKEVEIRKITRRNEKTYKDL